MRSGHKLIVYGGRGRQPGNGHDDPQTTFKPISQRDFSAEAAYDRACNGQSKTGPIDASWRSTFNPSKRPECLLVQSLWDTGTLVFYDNTECVRPSLIASDSQSGFSAILDCVFYQVGDHSTHRDRFRYYR